MKIAEVMTQDVATVEPKQSLEEAAKLLVERNVSGVPVVEDGKVVGILSERDLLDTKTIPRPPRYLELLGGIIYLDDVDQFRKDLEKTVATRVEQVMVKDVITVTSETSLEEAAQLILKHRINRLPVTDGGKLVGIVTRSDLLRGSMQG